MLRGSRYLDYKEEKENKQNFWATIKNASWRGVHMSKSGMDSLAQKILGGFQSA